MLDTLSPPLLLLLILKDMVSYSFIVPLGPTIMFDFLCPLYDLIASDDTQKSHKSRHRMQRSLGSSHKHSSRSLSGDSQSKGSICMPQGSMVCYINLFWFL